MQNKILYTFIFFLSFNVFATLSSIKLPVKSIPKNLKIDELIQVDQNRIATLVVDGLVEVGENFGVVPRIAQKVYWENEGKKLIIELSDTRFSDGSKIEKNHVLNSLKRCILRSSKGATFGITRIIGIEKFLKNKKKLLGLNFVEKNKVTIALKEPAPMLVDELSHTACSIIKPNKKNGYDLLEGAIGSGPYKIESSSRKQITLTKNKYFMGLSSGPANIVFKPTDHAGNIEKLAGWADLIIARSKDISIKGYNRFRYTQLVTWQLGFNNSAVPFDNELLRKAVSLSINFNELMKALGWKKGRMQKSLFPFGIKGFKRREKLEADQKQANKIFNELGFSDKKHFKFIITIAKYSKIKEEIKAWQEAFKGSLVDVKVEALSQKDLIAKRKKGSFMALRYGKAAGSIDANLLLASYLKDSKFNTPKVNQPECDRIIKKALYTSNQQIRDELYIKAGDCLMRKNVIVPLASANPGYALVRKPWQITRTNQYLLYPYKVNEWKKNNENIK